MSEEKKNLANSEPRPDVQIHAFWRDEVWQVEIDYHKNQSAFAVKDYLRTALEQAVTMALENYTFRRDKCGEDLKGPVKNATELPTNRAVPRQEGPFDAIRATLKLALSEHASAETGDDWTGMVKYFKVYETDLDEIAKALAAGQAASGAQRHEHSLRQFLWLNHGHTGLYGDDGEMQCDECHIDYKRDSFQTCIESANNAVIAIGMNKLAAPATLSVDQVREAVGMVQWTDFTIPTQRLNALLRSQPAGKP